MKNVWKIHKDVDSVVLKGHELICQYRGKTPNIKLSVNTCPKAE